MSNIDKQALREAAERATESDWIVDAHEGWHAVIPVADAVNGNYIIAEFQGPESKRNRDFVAAANPTTVLALLDELEDYKAAYEEEYRDKEVQRSVIDDALCKLLPGCQYMDPPDGGSVTPLEQVSRMIADYCEQLLAAERRCAALAAENTGLKQFPDQIVGFIGKLGSSEIGSETKEKIEAAAKKIKTPATDAFLVEVRAQGVEMFVTKIASGLRAAGGAWGVIQEPYHEFADHLESKGEDFAAQLRKGGA